MGGGEEGERESREESFWKRLQRIGRKNWMGVWNLRITKSVRKFKSFPRERVVHTQRNRNQIDPKRFFK